MELGPGLDYPDKNHSCRGKCTIEGRLGQDFECGRFSHSLLRRLARTIMW